MGPRLIAAGIGVAIAAIGCVVFLQTRHPQVVATNGAAAYTPAWAIPGGVTRCQLLRKVPSGANRLRMALSNGPKEGIIQAVIYQRSARIAGAQLPSDTGNVNFKLGRTLPALHRARLCVSNPGSQRMVFLGEYKKPRNPGAGGLKRPVPSIIFLYPGSASWLGRAGTIIKRFGYVQAGVLAGWTLWLAGALGLAMFGLALWLVVSQRGTRAPPRQANDAGRTTGPIRAQLARIPPAAWGCALVALLSALTWSLIVPLFQVPDEQAHVAYAQHLAEVGAPPAGQRGSSSLSEDERRLFSRLRSRAITHRPENPPLSTPRAHRQLEEAVDEPADRAGAGGYNNATQNPPLYYGLAAIGYRLSPFTDLPDRIHAMRIVSALLAALTALLAYLFIREVFPATPWAWTVGGLAVAAQPMFGFIGGGVNNDNLLFAASAGVLLTLAIGFRRGLTLQRGIALGACIAAGLLAKASMFGLIPGIVGGVALIVARTPAARRQEALRAAGAAALVAAAPFLLYMAFNSLVWGRDVLFGTPQAGGQRTATAAFPTRPSTLSGHLSYLWQFYLPRLDLMRHWFPVYEARAIWLNGFIGRFGWLDYGFPGWVYDFGLVAGATIVIMAWWELISKLDAVRRRITELLAYVLIAGSLLVLLGWIGYDWRRSHPGQFEQARYILPLLALYGALITLAVRSAGRRWGPVVGVLIVTLALGQSVLAMLITLTRYYG